MPGQLSLIPESNVVPPIERVHVSVQSSAATLRTLDGLQLAATLVAPIEPAERAVVLVHGGGVTREEGGFFTRLAAGLGDAKAASLRFDLRGHGESEGRQNELTLATILNDIRLTLARGREWTGESYQPAGGKLQW
jgi:hypothetical protein